MKLPDFSKLAAGIEDELERLASVAATDAREEAERNIRRLRLVKRGKLVASIRDRARGSKAQIGTISDYGNIYNFGGTVRQRTKNGRYRVFKVGARTFISHELNIRNIERLEKMMVQYLENNLEK